MEGDGNGSGLRLGSALRPLLTYGVPIVGAGVWAFAKFPERLRWTSELQARVFGLAAAFYEDLTHVEGYGEALDAAIEALETPPTRVLDLGCGTGYAARAVQEAFPDAEVVGVDLSPEMVLIARREADDEGFDIEFEVGDAADLDFDDEGFDLVVSHNAPPFPGETMRVLRPAGTALTVWSFGGPWVGLAWPAVAKEFKKAGVLYADGFRAGPGFYGIAEKSGIRRRRRPR
ncbi:MAG: class I SAM-dependent methyltransferase, partial [Actinomycetota bacterium]